MTNINCVSILSPEFNFVYPHFTALLRPSVCSKRLWAQHTGVASKFRGFFVVVRAVKFFSIGPP